MIGIIFVVVAVEVAVTDVVVKAAVVVAVDVPPWIFSSSIALSGSFR